ncbi:hypothetical protein [uncultured Eudoraea sp.]|uniref:hypothetical protein n=1 Tax=uncultured Eudoraea sp. TaxID=1035614 RepID=UPI00262C415A|nr:hypothetical protein [uncultured Eudoraea sp.]
MNPWNRILFILCLYLGFGAELNAQDLTAQQKERQAEKDREPRLFVYDTTYLASVQAERAEILRQKILIDCLDISDKKRDKLLRDLYRHKRSKRLNKILLATTTYEEEAAHDPDNDK